jgi:hypothetical protein
VKIDTMLKKAGCEGTKKTQSFIALKTLKQ